VKMARQWQGKPAKSFIYDALAVHCRQFWPKRNSIILTLSPVVWLIIGLFRGRKRGMSQELLPLLQWMGIVAAGGLLYWPFSPLVHQYTQFGTLWSLYHGLPADRRRRPSDLPVVQTDAGRKAGGKDPFGRAEFYLGMMAGVVRFACMLLVGMALMNSHVKPPPNWPRRRNFRRTISPTSAFPLTANSSRTCCSSLLREPG
jgi:hypothetical protein